MESNQTNPNDVPIAHICNNQSCKGTLKPYPVLFCSLCQDGKDCSTNDLVREVNSLRKAAEVNRVRDLAWLDFELQFAADTFGQTEEECFDKMLHARTHLDLMGSIKFLYHLATNSVPFPGNNDVMIMTAHLKTPLTPPEVIAPSVSPRVSALIQAMMEKSPDDRPQTAIELKQLIEQCQRGEMPTRPGTKEAPAKTKSFFGRLFSKS